MVHAFHQHFSTSADFTMWVLAAVSFRGLKKSQRLEAGGHRCWGRTRRGCRKRAGAVGAADAGSPTSLWPSPWASELLPSQLSSLSFFPSQTEPPPALLLSLNGTLSTQVVFDISTLLHFIQLITSYHFQGLLHMHDRLSTSTWVWCPSPHVVHLSCPAAFWSTPLLLQAHPNQCIRSPVPASYWKRTGGRATPRVKSA